MVYIMQSQVDAKFYSQRVETEYSLRMEENVDSVIDANMFH